MGNEDTYLVEMKAIRKNFGRVQALKGVDFHIRPDEIVGLVGDNGAGKSTLVKILVGAIHADDGYIIFNGEQIYIENPRQAREFGFGIIYQNSALIDNANVRDNIFLGDEPKKPIIGGLIKVVDRRKMNEESWRVLEMVHSTVESLKTEVQYLSGGQQKTVAIGRVILHEFKLVIMDEPTAGLGVGEVSKFLDIVQQLKDQGTAVIYITHRLQDLFIIADRIVVLRGGKNAGERVKDETTQEEIIKMIVGTETSASKNSATTSE
jgi:ABC-type sugar transport system ATPase subunit